MKPALSVALLVLAGCAAKPSLPTTSAKVSAPTSTGATYQSIPFGEKELGFRFYPHSMPVYSGSMILKVGGKNAYAYTAETSDDLAKICDFYRAQAPGAKEYGKPATGLVVFSGIAADGRAFQVTLSEQKKTGKRMVHIMMTGERQP